MKFLQSFLSICATILCFVAVIILVNMTGLSGMILIMDGATPWEWKMGGALLLLATLTGTAFIHVGKRKTAPA